MRKQFSTFAALCLGLTMAGTAAAQEVTNEFGTGLIPLSDEEYDALDERDPLLRGALPEYVDLSSFFPVPGHQGAQGSCVGWAVGYALKTYQEAKETRAVRPTEDRHFSPSFVFNSIKAGDDCKAGSRITDALNFVQTTGAVSMYDFPYIEDACPAPPEDLLSRGEDYQIQSFNRLERGDLFAIQEALSNEKPVVAGMYVYPSFQNWYGDGVYEHDPQSERRKDYHAVTIVGYDDEREAIRLINSWGTEWGDGGYAWVGYDAAEKLIREAYVTTDNNLFGDFNSIDPDQVYAVLSGNTSDSMAGATAPETPPEPVTERMLETAVTGHVGRDPEGRTPSGYDYYPASVWLTLEQPQLDQIESVEYYFYHSTFSNPMRPVADSNVFLATWKGYGCIENAEVQVTLKTGEMLSAPFSLCQIWDRFHPGAFRKDGRSSGTNPLRSEDSFSKQDRN